MTDNGLRPETTQHTLVDLPGVRNAWQWLAMLTMTLDHIGYLYPVVDYFRYAGRLGMPLYAILFVVTIQKHQIHLKRILLLAMISQIPYQYIFQLAQLNIIFGFSIFAWTAIGVEERNWFKIVTGALMMLIPVSYGWYLYLTLGIFYWLNNKHAQRSAFTLVTAIYTVISGVHPRQMLAVAVPFLTRLKAPRPNKYLYRWFYPGHLAILAVLYYFTVGPIPYSTDEPYDKPDSYYYDDSNEPDFYYGDPPVYDVGKGEQ